MFFDYQLPRHLIAQEPLRTRSDARLMLVDRQHGSIDHFHVRDLPELLRPADLLVLNDTKVVPAQLAGIRERTGGRWQGLYLRTDGEGHWRLVCKTRGRLLVGEAIALLDREGRTTDRLFLLEKQADGEWVAHPESDRPAEQVLEASGRVPLPHYIRGGQMVDADRQSYQTVYARRPGAVAAPTAGLHFTPELLRRLQAAEVALGSVTLHVGMGTFRPVTAERPEDHPMHAEWGELPTGTVEKIAACRASAGRVVAVGTTSVRVLESAAAATSAAGSALAPWSGDTRLFIYPPYEFRVVQALLTNFHFPRTTLLLLVQALGGSELVEAAYRTAIEQQYRFYSYGDAMLIV